MKVVSKSKLLSFMTFIAFFKSYIRKDIDESVKTMEEIRSPVLDNIYTHVVSFMHVFIQNLI